MTTLTQMARALFGKRFDPDAYDREIDQLARQVAGRFSRGNIAQQHGFVLTQTDLDRERDEMLRRHRQVR